MGSLPNLHELGNGKEDASRPERCERPRALLARAPTAPAQHQRVFKSKSNGHAAVAHVCADDFTLDQQQHVVSGYSPVSSRCTRIVRRRDSLSSSIGATSVRRLISAVGGSRNRGGGRLGSSGTSAGSDRRRSVRTLLALCIAHATGSSALLPHLTLQSVAPWGSWLTALTFACAVPSALLAPIIIRRSQSRIPLLALPATLLLCHAAHLMPTPILLVPTYILLGVGLGIQDVMRNAALLSVASRLAPSVTHHHDDEDEIKTARRACAVRRAARALQAAQDLGLILGSALAALIISYTGTNLIPIMSSPTVNTNFTLQISNTTNCTNTENNTRWCDDDEELVSSETSAPPLLEWPDAMFNFDESGEGICGARTCPNPNEFDITSAWRRPIYTEALAATFAVLALVALLATIAAVVMYPRGPADPPERPAPPGCRAIVDSFKDFRLQLAAPLVMFIGMEQAFMFADFGKTYVVCTLGVERLNLVFVGMGLLQSVAACTLSMVLRPARRRRYLVVAIGCAFHACLLLVQRLWKPSGDDAALFYVISAAWGVCNAIWEILTFTLITGAFGDSVASSTAAFANLFFFRHAGLTLAFATHGLLCTATRLYILAVAMVLAALPYAVLELRLENLRKLRSISRL